LDKPVIDTLGIKGFGAKKLKADLIGVDVMTPEGRAKLEETLGKAQILNVKAEDFLGLFPPITKPEVTEPLVAGVPESGVSGESTKQPVSQPVSAGLGANAAGETGVGAIVKPTGQPTAGKSAQPSALKTKKPIVDPKVVKDYLANKSIEGDVKTSLAALETAKPKEFNAHLDYLTSGSPAVQKRIPKWVTPEQIILSKARNHRLEGIDYKRGEQDTVGKIESLKTDISGLESE
jgi:hypothetical protein